MITDNRSSDLNFMYLRLDLEFSQPTCLSSSSPFTVLKAGLEALPDLMLCKPNFFTLSANSDKCLINSCLSMVYEIRSL